MGKRNFPMAKKGTRGFSILLVFCVFASSFMFAPMIYAAPFNYGEPILPTSDVSIYVYSDKIIDTTG